MVAVKVSDTATVCGQKAGLGLEALCLTHPYCLGRGLSSLPLGPVLRAAGGPAGNGSWLPAE